MISCCCCGFGLACGGGRWPYWLEVDEQSFQATLEASMTAPVLLVFYSPSRLAESEQMARDLLALLDDALGCKLECRATD